MITQIEGQMVFNFEKIDSEIVQTEDKPIDSPMTNSITNSMTSFESGLVEEKVREIMPAVEKLAIDMGALSVGTIIGRLRVSATVAKAAKQDLQRRGILDEKGRILRKQAWKNWGNP